MITTAATRRRAVSDLKRGLILDAARHVFEAEGLEGASLRSIAAKAGYTPAALYFHFDSKEAIYAEVLAGSLESLNACIAQSIADLPAASLRFEAAALAWFDFYTENPSDLDLGFYLFRAGMRPAGLGPDRDAALNAALQQSLAPLFDAACEMGVEKAEARYITAGVFAHATGILLLAHTHRVRLFKVEPRELMEQYVASVLAHLRSKTI